MRGDTHDSTTGKKSEINHYVKNHSRERNLFQVVVSVLAQRKKGFMLRYMSEVMDDRCSALVDCCKAANVLHRCDKHTLN